MGKKLRSRFLFQGKIYLILPLLLSVLTGCPGNQNGPSGSNQSGPTSALPTPPTAVSYSSPTSDYTIGTAITPNLARVTGGAATNFTISPSLPTGLLLDSSTGTISGTPTIVASQMQFIVTASNLAGSVNMQIFITVEDIAPTNLVYGMMSPNYSQNQPITNNVPSNSGGTILQYSVKPALPLGLTLNTSTGVISGTPRIISTPSSYTITGTGSQGMASASLTIAVVGPPAYVTLKVLPPVLSLGQCFGVSLGGLIDIDGNPSSPLATLTFTLSAASTGGVVQFFTDNQCTVPNSSATVTLSPAVPNTTFYILPMSQGNYSLTATAPPSSSSGYINVEDQLNFTIPPVGNNSLTLGFPGNIEYSTISSSPPLFNVTQSLNVDECIPLNILFQNSQGNPSPAPANGDVFVYGQNGDSVAANQGISVFSDTDCKQPMQQASQWTYFLLPVIAGQTQINFSIQVHIIKQLSIAFTNAFDNSAVNLLFTNMNTLAATSVTNASYGYPTVGLCSPVYLYTVDQYGNYANPATVPFSTTLTVPTSASASLFSDSACTQPTNYVTILPGNDMAIFYVLDPAAEVFPLSVSNNAGAFLTSLPISVLAPSTYSGLSSVIADGPGTVIAGECFLAQAQVVNGNNGFNTAPSDLTMTLEGNFNYFSDVNCSIPITQVTVSTGNVVQNFYAQTAATGLNEIYFYLNPWREFVNINVVQ